MGKHILEAVFGVITQIIVMDWWVKGSPSAGPVLAAMAQCREVLVLTSPSCAPWSKSGSCRTGCCICPTESRIKEYSEKTGKPPLRASCHLLCADKSIFNSYDASYSESA